MSAPGRTFRLEDETISKLDKIVDTLRQDIQHNAALKKLRVKVSRSMVIERLIENEFNSINQK